MNENSDWLDGMLYYVGWGLVIGVLVGALFNGLISLSVTMSESVGVFFLFALFGGVVGGLTGAILGVPLSIVHKLLFQMRQKVKNATLTLSTAAICVFTLSLFGSLLIIEATGFNIYVSGLRVLIGIPSSFVAAVSATIFFVYSVRKQQKGTMSLKSSTQENADEVSSPSRIEG